VRKAPNQQDRLARVPVSDLRDQGLLLCCCVDPDYEWLSEWTCYQCRRCWKLIR
jgi:hypothetical protein